MAKMIIDGKRYDTDTADFIHTWDSGHSQDDLHFLTETLYRSPKGTFFLEGEGGAGSSYSRSVGSNTSTSGRAFTILSPEEALTWLEEHDADEETIASYFNLPEG